MLQAQRTRDAVPILQKAEHAFLLSGTPMISRPKEMLTLLSALVPEAKLKMKDFGERYCLSSNPKAYSKYDGIILSFRSMTAVSLSVLATIERG